MPIHFGLLLALLLTAIGRPPQVAGAEPTPPFASGTGDYLIQNWQAEEGLPRSTITALTQDRQGYLWLGTPQGLIRFDGVRFVAFEGASSPALAQGWVQSLLCDDAGTLWIATRRSGLLRYQDGAIMAAPSLKPTTTAAIDSLAQDGRGNLWVTEGNGMLERLAANKFTPTTQLNKTAQGPMLFKLTTDAAGGLWFFKQNTYGQLVGGQPTNVISFPDSVILLAPSHAGGMWISTGENLWHRPAGQTATNEMVLPLPFGTYGVSALYEDRSGTLWMGTMSKGLFRLRDGSLEPVGKINHNISAILEDAEGNLWVTTDGEGLFKLRPRVFDLISKNEGLPQEKVASVSGDWVAPVSGGWGKISPSGRVEMVPGFERRSVASILEDGAGGIWQGTSGGRLFRLTGDGQQLTGMLVESPNIQLRVLHRDQKGDLWVGCFPHGLFRLPAGQPRRLQNLSSQGFTNVSVTAITEDANGVLWIGTSRGDLWRFENGRFHQFGTADGLPGFSIGALLAAPDGALWVGTLGGGLGQFQAGKARFMGIEAGLIDNVITQLIMDRQGWLWMGSSRGIARTREAELLAVLDGQKPVANITHYGRADGLANIQCAAEFQPSAWLTKEGLLRFATSRGVVNFNPAAIPLNLRPPPLALETILVDGILLTNRMDIKLPHNYRKIEFRYAAMSFVAPENVMFKRRLVGFDEGWVADGTQRSVTYPRLPPGHYTFQFNACNNDGVWNDSPFQVAFEVVPAFWQTLWFRTGVVVLFTILVAGSVRYAAAVKLRRKLQRLEQAHLLERERTRISRDLHDDLGARLTQMAFMTDLAAEEAGAPAAMQTKLRDVSRQARNAVQSLDETVWMVNPQKDTLPHLIAYLATYAEQFFQPTNIACRQEICRRPPETPLSGKLRRDIFLLVKEALNNVLKHSKATEVWLKISVRGPVLRIVIQDDGQGFLLTETKGHRNGLENMRRRAAAAGIRFRLRSIPGQGTRLVFRAGFSNGVSR
ncbi:MAG TPA: two-component regulator propeller domain-containing protein [bacterium]|nr:two-component regulator propeller domain-containing protein [bacterium]